MGKRRFEVIFEKGKLYVRIHDRAVAELFYPEQDAPVNYSVFGVQNVAEVEGDHAHPSFYGAVEMAQDGECSGSGMLIQFRPATDEDLERIMKTWESRVTVAGWILEVCRREGILLESEKDRLVRIGTDLGYL